MTVEPNNSKNLLVNNTSNLYKKPISAKFLSNMESDIPMIYFPEVMRKASCKCKQNTNKSSAAKKRSKKIKTNAKLSERMSKLNKLHFLRDDDLATKIKHEKIKQISKKELVFNAPFFKLCTVLQVLQKINALVQKIRAKVAIDNASLEKIRDFQLLELKPNKAQKLDKNPQQRAHR